MVDIESLQDFVETNSDKDFIDDSSLEEVLNYFDVPGKCKNTIVEDGVTRRCDNKCNPCEQLCHDCRLFCY